MCTPKLILAALLFAYAHSRWAGEPSLLNASVGAYGETETTKRLCKGPNAGNACCKLYKSRKKRKECFYDLEDIGNCQESTRKAQLKCFNKIKLCNELKRGDTRVAWKCHQKKKMNKIEGCINRLRIKCGIIPSEEEATAPAVPDQAPAFEIPTECADVCGKLPLLGAEKAEEACMSCMDQCGTLDPSEECVRSCDGFGNLGLVGNLCKPCAECVGDVGDPREEDTDEMDLEEYAGIIEEEEHMNLEEHADTVEQEMK